MKSRLCSVPDKVPAATSIRLRGCGDGLGAVLYAEVAQEHLGNSFLRESSSRSNTSAKTCLRSNRITSRSANPTMRNAKRIAYSGSDADLVPPDQESSHHLSKSAPPPPAPCV